MLYEITTLSTFHLPRPREMARGCYEIGQQTATRATFNIGGEELLDVRGDPQPPLHLHQPYGPHLPQTPFTWQLPLYALANEGDR